MAAFTAQLPNVMSQLGGLLGSSATGSAGLNVQSRATFTLGNKRAVQKKETQKHVALPHRKHASNWFNTPAAVVPGFDHSGGIHNQFQWNNFSPNFQVNCGQLSWHSVRLGCCSFPEQISERKALYTDNSSLAKLSAELWHCDCKRKTQLLFLLNC
jgi:hypothetical protein